MQRAVRAHSRSRRLLQALWISLYALSLLLSTAHYSFISHRVCEHGDVAHVEAGVLAHCDGGLANSRSVDWSAPSAAAHVDSGSDESAPPEEDGHEHCELDPATQAAPAFELSPLTFAQWLDECFGPASEPAPRAPDIAILRLAPGHSPPRA